MFKKFTSWSLHIPHREDNVFSLAFAIIICVPLLFNTFFPEGFESVKYALFLFLTGIGGLILFSRKNVLIDKKIFGLVVGFWLLNILSTIFSLDIINSIIGLYARYTGSVFFLTAWVLAILIFWNAVKDDDSRKWTLLRVFVFNSLIISVYGLTQYFDIFFYSGPIPQVRPIIPSTIGNQNFYAMFLSVFIPAVIILFYKAQGFWSRAYYAITGFIMMWALVTSGSRGGILGLIVTCVVFGVLVLWKKYPKHLMLFLGILVVIGVVLFQGFFKQTRTDFTKGVSENAIYTEQTRYIVWSEALQIIKKTPYLGVGPGNFYIALEGAGDIALTGNERFDDAHNLVLNITSTTGIPAIIIFLILCGLIIFRYWRMLDKKDWVALWGLPAFLGLLVSTSFNPVSISIWLLIAVIMAFAFNLTMTKSLDVIFVSNKWRIGGYILSSVLIIFAICFIVSEIFTVYGMRAYRAQNSTEANSLLHSALLMNPYNTSARSYKTGAMINEKKNVSDIEWNINKITSDHPKSGQIRQTTGNLYYKLFRMTNDTKYLNLMNNEYDKGIELEPNSLNLYNNAAYSAYKAGDIDRAMKILNKVLSLPESDKYPYSWLLRAKILLDKNDKTAGLRALETGYKSLPEEKVIKHFIDEVKKNDDVTKLQFPVFFPEVDI